MWHKQSFTQFWSQSDAYSRRSSLKLTYIHHPLVVCTHQICCAVAVPIALSQDRLLHGHNRLVNWTPCSRMRESKLKSGPTQEACGQSMAPNAIRTISCKACNSPVEYPCRECKHNIKDFEGNMFNPIFREDIEWWKQQGSCAFAEPGLLSYRKPLV